MEYLALLRGINVGGKNRLKMAELKECFEELGFKEVATYIQSGNVLFETDESPATASELIETVLPKKFKLDSQLIKVLVLSKKQFETIVDNAPKGFGRKPEKYYYDFIFLKDIDSKDAIKEFDPHPEVDNVWPGPGVIYHRRLGAKRTKSRLSKTAGRPIYKSMTVRSWTTTNKLRELMGL